VDRHRDAFAERGAQVVAVGQGTGAEAAQVAREEQVALTVLGDPGKASYRTLGLGRGSWWSLLVAPMLENLAEAFSLIGKASLRWSANPRSDVRQLGGVMIVDPEGVIRYLHRSATTTDVPPTTDLLEALDRIASAREA
jgi:peroxiredoxin